MNLSKTQLYLLMQKSPHLALLEFMKQIEAKNEETLKTLIEQKLEEKLSVVAEQVRTAHDQELINNATKEMLTSLEFKGEIGDKGDSGEEGYTPVKGVDYFTPEEVKSMADEVFSRIQIPPPIHGKTPKAGIDYPNYDQVENLVKLYVAKMPQYNETVVLNKILTKVQETYPKVTITGEDVVTMINNLPIDPKFQIDYKHIKNTPKIEKAGKAGKAGGGMGNVTHQHTSIGSATATVTLTSPVSGGGFALWVYYNGQFLARGTDYTVGSDYKTLTLLFTPQDNTVIDIVYIRG